MFISSSTEKPRNDAPLVRADDLDASEKQVRIVFVLTVNGRAARQVRRLIKTLYHTKHYFFIHVDKVCGKSLTAVWSKASQWREMFCHNPEGMGLNPSQVKHGNG